MPGRSYNGRSRPGVSFDFLTEGILFNPPFVSDYNTVAEVDSMRKTTVKTSRNNFAQRGVKTRLDSCAKLITTISSKYNGFTLTS